MNIAVRYYTRSGNTEKLARAIAGELGVAALGVDVPLDERADILFLGCSYYAFDVDEAVKQFVFANRENIGEIVCFGTSAMMKSVYKPMKKLAAAAGVELRRQDFHCRGRFYGGNKGHPDETDLKNAVIFAKNAVK